MGGFSQAGKQQGPDWRIGKPERFSCRKLPERCFVHLFRLMKHSIFQREGGVFSHQREHKAAATLQKKC